VSWMHKPKRPEDVCAKTDFGVVAQQGPVVRVGLECKTVGCLQSYRRRVSRFVGQQHPGSFCLAIHWRGFERIGFCLHGCKRLTTKEFPRKCCRHYTKVVRENQSELHLKEARPRSHGDGHRFHLLAYCLTQVTKVHMVSHHMFVENDCTRVCGLHTSRRIWIRVASARALHCAKATKKKCGFFSCPGP
jgi:hypothetical protein